MNTFLPHNHSHMRIKEPFGLIKECSKDNALEIYDLNGYKRRQLNKGINIIRSNNGVVKKLFLGSPNN